MNLLCLWFNQAYAFAYVSHSNTQTQKTELPHIPQLITIERILLITLLFILAKPLLREQKDPKLEKERVRILQLSAIVGGLALAARFYRTNAGH